MSQLINRTESRLPNPMTRVPALADIGAALAKALGSGSVPDTTISFAQLLVGQRMGSDYLVTLHTAGLRRAGETEERIADVTNWEESALFDEPERVALALADALLTPNPDDARVSDELYARASASYDDTSLTTLILGLGQVFFFVPLAVIGEPLAGKSPAEQWRP
ncbi:MAG TPA: carboxymuconolactone decarboxylase family protein [Pseudolysinimonas sp.]|nr:carboxymuconolactone decarboxylase family protein [Pseudolysinimonas sp.]